MTQPQTDTKPCPYCVQPIPTAATRCPHCAGQMMWCPDCGENVALTAKRKFVGFVRGGTAIQQRCAKCDKLLDGPRW